jgi:solute:Na+ symporter, SSS family
MATADYIIILLYCAGMLLLGGILSRSIKNASDMFVAGKTSPWWLSGLSGYMSFFSAATFVVWGSIAFKFGLVSVSISMTVGISAFLAGLFLAQRWRRLGVSSAAEFIKIRYGTAPVQYYTWVGMIFRMFAMGVALYSFAVLITALMPLNSGHFLQDPLTGNLSVAYATVICGFIVVFYTVAGGLWAVMISDALQFIVLAVSVLFVVPLAFMEVGGIGAFVEAAPATFFSPVNPEFTWLFLTGWMAVQFFKIGGEWVFIQRFLSVPTPNDARKSAYLFGALYLVSPLIWMLPPMLYRIIDPGANPEQAYILACKTVLPVGMMGLMIAGMFSATASMIDSELNVFAGVLTRDFYQGLLRPRASESHLVWVGRGLTVVLGAMVVSLSLLVPYIGGAEKVVLSVTGLLVGPMVLPTIWGLFSRRVGQSSIWVTSGVTFLVGGILKFGFTGAAAASGLGLWVNTHMRALEVGVGVLVPFAVLLVLEWLATGTSPRYLRLQQFTAANREEAALSPSAFPGQIVGYGVGVLAVVMAVVAFTVEDQGHIVLLFSLFLLALSATLLWLSKREPRIKEPEKITV